MKTTFTLLTLLLAASMTACGNSPKTQSSPNNSVSPASSSPATRAEIAYALGSKKKGDQGICVVCNVKEGTTEEETAAETLDYQGKTYIFCNESEKAEFISEPTRFVK